MLGIMPDEGYPWSGERAAEIYETFENIINAANEKNADFLIIAGNLFDHTPDADDLAELDRLAGRLENTRIIYVAGKHDCVRDGSHMLSHTFRSNVFVPGVSAVRAGADENVFRDAQASMALDRLHFADKKLCVCGVSWYDGKMPVCAETPAAGDDDETAIFVCCADGEGHAAANMRELKKAGFAYAALGGKGRYAVRRGDIYCYSGSPEALGPGGSHGYVWGVIEDGRVRTEFVPVSKREYKTIHYPVNNYTGELELEEELARLLDSEGRENIYTINISRAEGCEKSFDISESLGAYRLLGIYGERFVRADYEEYAEANRRNEFGALLERLSEAGLDERESVKLAVDEIIDMSGLYKRKNKKMSSEMYRDARRQALAFLTARCESCENDEDMRAYESAKREYEISDDVLDELNRVWANERQTELAIKTARNRLAELPRTYRRLWVRAGVRAALIPFMAIGLLSVFILPSVISGGGQAGGMMLRVMVSAMTVAAVAYYIGYFTSKYFGARRKGGDREKLAEGVMDLRRELEELESRRLELHEQRVRLQALDGRRREMRDEIDDREKELETKRYELGVMKKSVDILRG